MKLTPKLCERLELIEKAISDKEIQITESRPYLTFEPFNMLNDEYNIAYYDRGKYTEPDEVVKRDKVPFWMILKIFEMVDDETPIFFNNTHCLEWFHLYFQNGDRLTQEQKERAKEKDINDYPFLAKLYDGDTGRKLREMISSLPEKGCFRNDFIKDIKKGTIRP